MDYNALSVDEMKKEGDDILKNINFGPEILKELAKKAENLVSTSKPVKIDPNFMRGVQKKEEDENKIDEYEAQKKKPNKGSRIEKLLRAFNSEYLSNLKGHEKLRKEEDIYQQYEKFTKELNSIHVKNRDEDLLKMQKENQEIEMILHDLKHQDKSELLKKEEESKELVEQLNMLFQQKKAEALEKDKERLTAIEEIKSIRKQQDELKKSNENSLNILTALEKDVEHLEKEVQSYENYKKFIDEVVGNNDLSNNQNSKEDYDKLKEKFENLIERMNEIKDNIEKQEQEIEEKRSEKNELKKKNDRQSQTQKVTELEELAKTLAKENENLEKEIEEIMKKNQKKETDNHQIMLSVINLYHKAKNPSIGNNNKDAAKKLSDLENVKESDLCEYLNTIGEKLNEYIAIYNKLESQQEK